MRVFQLRSDYCLLNIREEILKSAKAALDRGEIVEFQGVKFTDYELMIKFLNAYCSGKQFISDAPSHSGDEYVTRFFELLKAK